MIEFIFLGLCFFGFGDCDIAEPELLVDQYVFLNQPVVINIHNNTVIDFDYEFRWFNNQTEIIPTKSIVCAKYCFETPRHDMIDVFGLCLFNCGYEKPIYFEGVKKGYVVVEPPNEILQFMMYNTDTGFYVDPQDFTSKNEQILETEYNDIFGNFMFTANMTIMKNQYNQNGMNEIPNNIMFIPVYNSTNPNG